MILLLMWLSVFGYLGLQIFTLVTWKGKWHKATVLSAVLMGIVLIQTIVGFIQQSNLWPIFLLFLAPPAFIYQLILIRVKLTKEREKTDNE